MNLAKDFFALVTGLGIAAQSTSAQIWTQTSAPIQNWMSIASSADGNKLMAAANYVWISTNSGTSWSQTNDLKALGKIWEAVASSADGTKLVAASAFGGIYTSTNSGINWTGGNTGTLMDNNRVISVASSSDGNKLAAGIVGGLFPIYTSTDSGASWVSNTVPNHNWTSVSSSADGNKLVAVAYDGPVYITTNAGITWMSTSAPSNPWVSVASSADGTKYVAAWRDLINIGGIYNSTNSGASWQSNSVPDAQWSSVASSADGTKLAAVCWEGFIYTSTNAGTSWISNNAPRTSWTAIASSADGNKLVAGAAPVGGGPICTLRITPEPLMSITPSNSYLVLSWLVPSTNFELQQSSDLSTTNWLKMTNKPVLNLTNLENEVVLLLTNGSGFFRLKTP